MRSITFQSLRHAGSTIAVVALVASAGCGEQGPKPWPGATAPGATAPGATAPGTAPAAGTQAAGDTAPAAAAPAEQPAAAAEPEAPQAPAPAHESKGFRITLTATFADLPEGARIIAPSPRDRRYQKVAKSEHSGAPGAVMPAEDNDNLFFVSDALPAGAASYTGVFEVVRRQGTQGAIQGAEGQDYDDSAPKVGDASTDAGLIAAAEALGVEKKKPYDEVLAVLKAALGMTVAADGAADAAKAIADKRASALGLANATVELLKLRGVPAQVVQGLEVAGGDAAVTSTHAWVDANLPQLGWVPLDPAKRRSLEDWPAEAKYVGFLPVDRVDLAYGAATVLAEDGTFPRTTLTGDLAAPLAVKDGARVGTVTWSAKVEALPDAE
jgi:hypothetical protein